MRGLGIDLCGVERIERELKRGGAFLHRFFTNSERAYIASRGQMGAQSAAGRAGQRPRSPAHGPPGTADWRLGQLLGAAAAAAGTAVLGGLVAVPAGE